PDAVLTSMVKRVDLAVHTTVWDLAHGSFQPGNSVLGLKNKGVSYAEVRVDFPGKAAALQRVETLRQKIVSGEVKVPSNIAEPACVKVALGSRYATSRSASAPSPQSTACPWISKRERSSLWWGRMGPASRH